MISIMNFYLLQFFIHFKQIGILNILHFSYDLLGLLILFSLNEKNFVFLKQLGNFSVG